MRVRLFAIAVAAALFAAGCPEKPLDDERVEAVLRSSRAQLAAECSKESGTGELHVRVRFDVGATGDIRYARATAVGDDAGPRAPDALVACVQRVVAHLHFPASANGRVGIERTLRVEATPDGPASFTW